MSGPGMSDGGASVRLDKWLWAARFYKTRSQAAEACAMGRIEVGGIRAKASREVHMADALKITNDAGVFLIEVLLLSTARGPAAVAQGMYRETEASRAARLKIAEERKAMHAAGEMPDRRPSKRDRRVLQKWKGGIHRF